MDSLSKCEIGAPSSNCFRICYTHYRANNLGKKNKKKTTHLFYHSYGLNDRVGILQTRSCKTLNLKPYDLIIGKV